MPQWTTHTEGGSWSGGGTQVPDCSVGQRQAITNAYNGFISDSCLDCFPGLKECLQSKWNSVEIDCTDSACADLDGRQSGNTILICNTSATRVGPVLLHEMVHLCGGSELDAEAVEWACFQGAGATQPFGDDWGKFWGETDDLNGDDRVRVGKYVIWDSRTGEVWGKREEGGSWNSGSTVSKGDLCFQSSLWEKEPEGGGW